MISKEELRQQLKEMNDKNIQLVIENGNLVVQIAQLRAEIQRLTPFGHPPSYHVNVSPAMGGAAQDADMSQLRSENNELKRRLKAEREARKRDKENFDLRIMETERELQRLNMPAALRNMPDSTASGDYVVPAHMGGGLAYDLNP